MVLNLYEQFLIDVNNQFHQLFDEKICMPNAKLIFNKY